MTAIERSKVVIVDDERGVADTYADQLSSTYDVQTLYSGTDVLETLSGNVDVLLLDRRMPDITGREILDSIRDQGFDTRVAVMTAVEPGFDIIDMPFDDYVIKPVSRANLRETVDRLVRFAAYETHIREYYALSSKYAALQIRKTEAGLAASGKFHRLEAEIDRHRSHLNQIVASFDTADFEAIFREFDRVAPGPTGVGNRT